MIEVPCFSVEEGEPNFSHFHGFFWASRGNHLFLNATILPTTVEVHSFIIVEQYIVKHFPSQFIQFHYLEKVKKF